MILAHLVGFLTRLQAPGELKPCSFFSLSPRVSDSKQTLCYYWWPCTQPALMRSIGDSWGSLVAQWYRVLLQCRRSEFNPWVRKIPWKRAWHPTPVFLLRKSHGQRSLAGYGPWGHKESDTSETTEPALEILRT